MESNAGIILLVEDSEDFATLIGAHLRRAFADLPIVRLERLAQCQDELGKNDYSVILLDLNLPDSSGLKTLEAVLSTNRRTPIVVLTGVEDETLAVEAVRIGAQDYILKDALHLGTLVRSVRFAIERSQRRETDIALSHALGELDAARAAQQRLFPQAAPEIAGFDIAGISLPAASAGGDYFDYLNLPDGRLLSVVGDVSGHGLSSALLMVEVRACLHTLTNFSSDLSKCFAFLEKYLSAGPLSRHFLTMFGLALNSIDATYEFIGAGHTGYHIHSNGEIRDLRTENALLGFELNGSFEKSPPQKMESGDVIFIPTDGLHETHNSEKDMYGEARLLELVTSLRAMPSAAIIDAVRDDIDEFRGETQQQDDVTAIIIKRL